MEKNKKGIRISLVTIIMSAFVIIMCGIMLYSNILLSGQFNALVTSDQEYKQCQYKAKQMQESVNTLDNCLQQLVQSGNVTYIQNYVAEVESQRRENLVKDIDATTEEKYLKKAADASIALKNTDYHIIKLVVKGKDITDSVVPEEINQMALSTQEQSMKSEQLIALARSILYSNDYQNKKTRINSDINEYLNRVLNRENAKLEANENDLKMGIVRQQAFCIVLIVGMVFIAFMLYKLVITVLRHYVRQIISTKTLKPEGVYELRYLADAYNEKFEKIEQKEQTLIRRADYDSLTNIYNRGAFEGLVNDKLKEINDNTSAFVLLDVDNFKVINDTFGHEMGDKILSLISFTLQESFGENDILGRIGGDEFGVFIPSIPEEDLSYVKERVENINRQMSSPNASFPAITFSVGISLNFQGDTFKDAYGRADDALFYVKSHGRCGCRIYGSNNA
jgi:diguanylate cyclase (GGDEF)-like protein